MQKSPLSYENTEIKRLKDFLMFVFVTEGQYLR